MSKEMKMSDVFDLLPVNGWVSTVGVMDFLAIEDSGEHDCCSKRHAEYIAHAINVHDANQETITKQAERTKELTEALQDMTNHYALFVEAQDKSPCEYTQYINAMKILQKDGE